MTPPNKAAAGFWAAAAPPTKVATVGAAVVAMVGTGASVVTGAAVVAGGAGGASVVTGAGGGVVTTGAGGAGVVTTGAGKGTVLVVQIAQVVAGDGATDDGIQVYTGEEVYATEDQT